MKTCPICNKEVKNYFESSHKEPYTHHSPFEGIMMYGAYSADKTTLCLQMGNDGYIHFVFDDTDDERLVKLGVKQPVNEWDESEYHREFDDYAEEINNDTNYFDQEMDGLPF